MFGLGHPFTVYSAESEGWLIEKTNYDRIFNTCFAFTTTGEVYIDAELERCNSSFPSFAQARGISSDDTIDVRGHLSFVSLAKARRCTFADRNTSIISGLERDYLRPAVRQVLEHRVIKGIFIPPY